MNTANAVTEKTWSMKTLPVRIITPVALTILLFVLTIFLVIIPLIEKKLMDGKREGLMQLTDSAWSILNYYHSLETNKQLTQEKAQEKAVAHLRHMRYGPGLEDYFWINTMIPEMIMHPYRPDLEGHDISYFMDPAGRHLFMEMVHLVRQQKAGFVDYLWQWKGDASRIVPKISHVRGFEPWGWVVGTGIYVEDVREQIFTILKHLIITCLFILALFVSLSGYIIWQSVRAKKERLAALEQSRHREKQLLQADKMTSLGILLAGVAHEINNPATALMLNAPSLKKAWESFTPVLESHAAENPDAHFCSMTYPELGQRINAMLSAIEDNSARIKKIIADLKDFSRPTGAAMTDIIEIRALIERTVDLMRPHLKKATRKLRIEVTAGLPGIRGNFQKLQQVLINLLLNACQALDRQDQAIEIRAWMESGSGFATIQITDQGPGMPPKDLKTITEPFFTTRRDEGGSGLGLFISEKIVSDHRGVLEFESRPGQGLTARILLPAPPLSAPEGSAETEPDTRLHPSQDKDDHGTPHPP